MKYCGIDLHSNNSVVVVSDEDDRIVFQKRFPNDLRQIAGAVEPYRCQPDYEFATHIRCIRPTAYYDLGMKGLRDDAEPVMRKNSPSNEYVAHSLYRRDPW